MSEDLSGGRVWRCQCWGCSPCPVLGCSHLLPAPSQSLQPHSCFIHSGFHSTGLSLGYHPQQLSKCGLNSFPSSLGLAAEHLALPAVASSEALEAVASFERNICLWDSEWDAGVTVTALPLPRQRRYLCKHNLCGHAPCSTPWVTASSWLCSSELLTPWLCASGPVLDTPLNFVTLETDHGGNGRRHHCTAAWFYPLFILWELPPTKIHLPA